MNMSRNQIVMAAVGGVTLVAAAALGYLAFDAYSAKGEASAECDNAVASAQRLLRADISPIKESELAYRKNGDTLAGWSEAALAAAAVGDRAVKADVNPAAFKKKLMDEARALSELPGGVDGKIMKDISAFGSPEFIAGDKLPPEELLPRMQRLWTDVSYMVEKLQACGVDEIVKIAPTLLPSQTLAEQKEETPRKPKKKQKSAEEEKPAYTAEKFDVQFRAKPAAFVRAVNVLATCDRFIVVDSMSFEREGDMIAAALGEDAKTQSSAPKPTGRLSRRAKAVAEPEQPAEEPGAEKKGVATDPEKEAPFLVTLVVSTYDFGTAAAAPAADDQAGVATTPAPADVATAPSPSQPAANLPDAGISPASVQAPTKEDEQ